MNKIKFSFLTILLCTASLALTGCGSTDTEETIISSVEANHILVNVTNSNVKITLSKLENEEIDIIEVADENNGYLTSVQMTESKVSFIWPFAEAGKEYTLTAKINAKDNYQEETVSFKVENEMESLINISEDYVNTVISLIAKSNQRLIKIDTPYTTLSSVFEKAKIENAKLLITVYSGKHYKATSADSVLVGTITRNFTDKAVLDPFKNGYDIIANASSMGLTPSAVNNSLSEKKTYFAMAQVQFTMPESPAGVVHTANGFYSNDTIYTPIAEKDLPQIDESYRGEK